MNSILLASWLGFLAVLLLFIGIDLLREPEKSLIKAIIGDNPNPKEKFWKKTSEYIAPFIVPWFPVANTDHLQKKIIWAGEPGGITVDSMIGLKVLLLVIAIAVCSFLTTIGIPPFLIPMFALLAFFLPDAYLSRLAEERKKAINKTMPNMISLLATAIGAGVELGPALKAVGDKMTGPLGEELRRAWKHIATGKPRAVALREMAKRTGVNVVERFVETIITAEERGGMDLSLVLSNFQRDLRNSQMRKAQEEARKAPTKMLLPLVTCIFIPMLIILLTPIVFTILDSM
ncbi:MAG: type II secretion system F family protein [Thermosipho sp. (in: Bacteria)]|nr:type II secretion system F family protein [Thermosipho sp. (in: thermotogales)]